MVFISVYLVLVMILFEYGMILEILYLVNDMVVFDMVGYVFVWFELNIVILVYKGLVDVGVVSSVDWGDDKCVLLVFWCDFWVIYCIELYLCGVEMVCVGLDL